jgi:hypothetical protein
MVWGAVVGKLAILSQYPGKDIYDEWYPHIFREEDFEETMISTAQTIDIASRFGIAAIIENPNSGFDAIELAQQGGKAGLEKIRSIPDRETHRERICVRLTHAVCVN